MLIFNNVCLIEGGSESESENGTLSKDLKMEELWEAPSTRTGNAENEETENAGNEETEIKQETERTESYRAENGETEIKHETEGTYAFAYSVIFKEEHGQVKEEITEEQGGIDYQINEGEDPATNEGEDPATNEGEDPATNEREDLNVVEMKFEEEEDNNLQVTTQVLIYRVIVLSLSIVCMD
jgi:hypothetical protein